jgi:hypothetical protein
MNNYCRVLCMTLVTLLAAIVPVSAYTVSDDSNNAVRDAVLSYFHPVNGAVADVADGGVSITLENGEGLRKGARLSVFRMGLPFYHPITKDLIGHTEDLIGRIEVKGETEVKGRYLCTVLNGDLKTDDIVRVTSSPIKLAFFQDRQAEWSLSEMFYGSLKESQRFDIIETYTENFEEESLSELSRGLGAEAVLVLSTPLENGTRKLRVRLFWTEDAHMFAEIEESVDAEVVSSVRSEENLLDINLTDDEPWGNYLLEDGELFAFGDVVGNGERELIVSDGNDLRVYSMRDTPQEIWFLKGGAHERHLSIDVLDLNNNGRSEIFVTSLINGGRTMNSFALEYDSVSGYRRVWDSAPYFLRVMDDALLMQKFTSFGLFTGPVYKGGWENGNYKPVSPLKLPDGVNIYGFAYINRDKNGDAGLVSFDDDGYLHLYNNGQSVWKSTDSYGKFEISLTRHKSSMFDNTGDLDESSPGSGSRKAFVRGRLITIKTRRGEEIIVVKRIPLLKNMPGLGTGKTEIHSLLWTGGVMDEELLIQGISGPATDYQVDDNELFFIVRTSMAGFVKEAVGGDFLRGSRLYYYTFRRDGN